MDWRKFLLSVLAATIGILVFVSITMLLLCMALLVIQLPHETNTVNTEQTVIAPTDALACEVMCPSTSMNCTSWMGCRYRHKKVCHGFIALCQDNDDKDIEKDRPMKVAMVLNDQAIQQYVNSSAKEHETAENTIRMLIYAMLLLIPVLLAFAIIRMHFLKKTELNGDIESETIKAVVLFPGTVAPKLTREHMKQIRELITKKLMKEKIVEPSAGYIQVV